MFGVLEAFTVGLEAFAWCYRLFAGFYSMAHLSQLAVVLPLGFEVSRF